MTSISDIAERPARRRTRRWLSRHTPLPAIAWGAAEDAAVAALGIAASRRIDG